MAFTIRHYQLGIEPGRGKGRRNAINMAFRAFLAPERLQHSETLCYGE